MKNQILLISIMLGLMLNTSGQTIDLTFTAVDNENYVQLDSIKVMNRTQGGDTVLSWPDTVLVLNQYGGVTEIYNEGENLQVFQNYPNPVKGQTTLTLYLPERGKVNLVITDILGRQVINTERGLDKGYHSFRFTPGSGEIFFFTAYWRGASRSIKILNASSVAGQAGSFEYLGIDMAEPQLKAIKAIQSFEFSLGDSLLYIGYAYGLQSGMLDKPEDSDTCVLQFATNIPCPGTPIVIYDGQLYNTIQVFDQCWLKENLNVGERIDSVVAPTNNGLIEKYCYSDEETNCNIFGGLYLWDEMMQYTNDESSQGICPPGWHIPSDEEWKVLEGAVDSQYGIGDPVWEIWGYRGYDAALNLKSVSSWAGSGNGLDAFGFKALAAGAGGAISFSFGWLETLCIFWSSSSNLLTSRAYDRFIEDYSDEIGRSTNPYNWAYSVRCLRDY